MGDRPALPGAIGASHLRVYDTTAPDGRAGGTPHLHTVCTEAYYVIGGAGAVQTLTLTGFEETELTPGSMVWFTPGTIHRLVNRGDLEILVLMQNAGLPEAGDLVITFPPGHLADASAYDAVAALPPEEGAGAGTGAAARPRRDLAVHGFVALRDATLAGDLAPLRAFHDAAARLVGPRLDEWRRVLERGPAAEVARTADHIVALASGDPSHLGDASVHWITPGGDRRLGCCGLLGTFVP